MNYNTFYARIEQIRNIQREQERLIKGLANSIKPDDPYVRDLVEAALSETHDKEHLKENLLKVGIEDSDETVTPYPQIHFNEGYPRLVEINIETPAGINLCSYAGESDYDTMQAGITVKSPIEGKDGKTYFNEYDLAMAEIKRGELAEIDGLKPDNKEISLYTYSDPSSEDYTNKNQIDPDKYPNEE